MRKFFTLLISSLAFCACTNVYDIQAADIPASKKSEKIDLFKDFKPVVFDLRNTQDHQRVLKNPDKGWYHHYYDNCLTKYLLKNDSDLEKIPNMQHLFLRFAWCYLEPEEGKFNWALIDDIVAKWKPKGMQISLSITAQETGEIYATPKWVIEAGAKGNMYAVGSGGKIFEKGVTKGRGVWEPDYNDPIFLEKLANLQKAIAKRYDGKDFIVTITVASIGNWGEGHNHFTSQKKVPVDVIKKHIDIYKKYFKKSQIVVGDDMLAALHTPEEIVELREYVKSKKISYRDDSILVKWTYFHNPSKMSLMHPEFFDDIMEKSPVTLELEHYHSMLESGAWKGKNGQEHGAEVLKKVVDRTQCTFLGYHGYADKWLADNPDFTNEMANRVGYWLFIDEIELDPAAKTVKISWHNKGAARPYKKYDLSLKFTRKSDNKEFIVNLYDADTRKLLPHEVTTQYYRLEMPEDMTAGEYSVAVRLYKSRPKDYQQHIELGFPESFRTPDNFFSLPTFFIVPKGSQ